mmetsp:Transcript_30/g.111  ORF Transcript_30/g.111 Transcript_30/m.111 type:complete len:273 (-) Transcript_30:280-1098(-)
MLVAITSLSSTVISSDSPKPHAGVKSKCSATAANAGNAVVLQYSCRCSREVFSESAELVAAMAVGKKSSSLVMGVNPSFLRGSRTAAVVKRSIFSIVVETTPFRSTTVLSTFLTPSTWAFASSSVTLNSSMRLIRAFSLPASSSRVALACFCESPALDRASRAAASCASSFSRSSSRSSRSHCASSSSSLALRKTPKRSVTALSSFPSCAWKRLRPSQAREQSAISDLALFISATFSCCILTSSSEPPAVSPTRAWEIFCAALLKLWQSSWQ